MKIKVFSISLFVFIMLLVATAFSTEGLTPHPNNEYVLGKSLSFLFNPTEVTGVKVDGNEIAQDKYVVNMDVGILYVYGSVFQEEGDHQVALNTSAGQLTCQVTLVKSDVVSEYTTQNAATYQRGSLVVPTSTAGPEHSATNDRWPVIVREITQSQLEDLWIKWNINEVGTFRIDYWCPIFKVAAAVEIIVKDANGVHTISGIVADDTITSAYYIPVGNQTFRFTGGNDEYVLVKPIEARVHFLVDSIRLTGQVNQHDTTIPTVKSTAYSISDDTIRNVLFQTEVEQFIANLQIPFDCAYQLSSDSGLIEQGEQLRIYRIFDPTIENVYTITELKYVVVGGDYSVNDQEISDIPYNEPLDDFLSHITSSATVKVFNSTGEKTQGVIENGDVLKVFYEDVLVCQYTLLVTAASSEKEITSSVYNIAGGVITVPYGERLTDFMQNITVPRFAVLALPFENYETIIISKTFDFKVTAQDNSEKSYTVMVEIGDNDNSELQSEEYTIVNNVVSGVPQGVSITAFKGNLTAANGGSFEIFDENLKPKTSGIINGSETIRVYPRYRYAGNEYFMYAISCIPDYRQAGPIEIVWACEKNEKNTDSNKEFVYETFRDGTSFTTLRPGYDGTNSHAATNPAFRYTAEVSGVYHLQFYAAASVEGTDHVYNYTVNKNNQQLVGSSLAARYSALVDIGNYSLEAGDILSFCPTNSLTFVSAVVIYPVANYNAEQITKDIQADKESVFDISFSFDVDASSLSEGISLVSENGNKTPINIQGAGRNFAITTIYPLESGLKYSLIFTKDIKSTSGEVLSSNQVLPINAPLDKVRCTVRTTFTDASGKILGNISGAANMSIEASISSDTTMAGKVYYVQYRNNNVAKVNVNNLSSALEQTLNQSVKVEQGVNKFSVFVTDENNRLVTNTYYAK